MNNYFSLCTANFGVVPWFSLRFLRFLPAFLSFSFLLHLVCIVFDAIIFPLFNRVFLYKNRLLVIAFRASIVKIFLTIILICSAQAGEFEEIFMAKGEQQEISVRNLVSYSLGNKEVIKHKFLKSQNKIILRAASLGFSDLIINQKDKKIHYKIYVSSKREQLKKMEVAAALIQSGLKVKTFSDVLYVSGIITDDKSYQLYHQILRDTKLKIVSEVELDKEYAKQFISHLYQRFEQAGYPLVSCHLVQIQFQCQYIPSLISTTIKESYQKNFNVQFSLLQTEAGHKFKIYFVLVQKDFGEQLNSGMDRISMSLEKLIQDQSANLQVGDLLLQNNEFSSYLVATPSLSVLSGEKFEISMGEETPVVNQTATTQSTEFRFSGLKFSGELSPFQKKFKLKYQMQITQGLSENFAGPRGKSALLLELNSVKQVLDIDLTQKKSLENNIPWIKHIPLLGKLLSSQSTQKKHSILKLYLSLEEEL